MAQVSQKPVYQLRYRGVSVSIFENHAKSRERDIVFHKTSLQRSYRDDQGEWKTTTSFSRDDLPVAMLLLERAYEWILDAESARGRDDDTEE